MGEHTQAYIAHLERVLHETQLRHEQTREELEQERVRLAGCSVAALGYATGNNDASPGDYGYSVTFDDVKKLYAEKERLRRRVEALEGAQGSVLILAARAV